MDAANEAGTARVSGGTHVERASEREIVVTRTFDAPARIVYEAWSKPELFMRWWAPKSLGMPILSCEMDVRTGGKYRLVFGKDGASSWSFFGKYLDVIPNARMVWTNDEDDAGQTITTVTFEEADGRTRVTIHDLYPSAEALEAGSGSTEAMPEVLQQLDELLAELAASA